MAIEGPGQEELRTLAARLKEAGTEGHGFRRALVNQMGEAAKPLVREIGNPERLKPYMPDRYAAVLAADLSVTTQKLFAGPSPRISIVAKGRVHKRKVQLTEDGFINHPVFARGRRTAPRRGRPEDHARKLGIPVHLVRGWTWVNGQKAGMVPGWFTDPCERAIPDIRDHVLEAIDETARKVTGGR